MIVFSLFNCSHHKVSWLSPTINLQTQEIMLNNTHFSTCDKSPALIFNKILPYDVSICNKILPYDVSICNKILPYDVSICNKILPYLMSVS